MPFVTATDVQLLHVAIQGERSLLGIAVLACHDKLDAGTLAEWDSLNARVGVYLGDDPSTFRAASQMDTGQQLQREMQPWHDRLRSAGCANVPSAPPQPPSAGGLTGMFDALRDIGPIVLAIFLLREFGGRRW